MAFVRGKFTSQKLNKIRWKPQPKDEIKKPNVFITGSWDNELNALSVWHIPSKHKDLNDSNESDPLVSDADPKLLHELAFEGNVNDLKYVNSECFVAASSTGSLHLYKHQSWNQEPTLKTCWKEVHKYSRVDETAPCTGIDVYADHVISIGDDSRLVQCNINQGQPIRTIEEAESFMLKSVTYLKQNEIVTSNCQGQLNIWDLRKPNEEAVVRTLLLSGDPISINCLRHHPTQPTILASGCEDGSLCIWDLKNEKYPVTVLSAHNGPLLELSFHPLNPNHLFTCSMDSKIWQWDCSALPVAPVLTAAAKAKSTGASIGALRNFTQITSPWLACGALRQQMKICSLIPSSTKPINSLDILDDVLLCASDNEALYVISNLNL